MTNNIEKNSARAFHWVYAEWIALIIIIFLSIFLRLNFLEIPFERDEGYYSYFGKMVLNGAIPFKDFGDKRLAGIFYAYAFMVFIFGYSVKALHIGFLVVNILTVIIMYLISKSLFSNITGLIAASSFSLLSLNPMASGFTAQSEHLVVLLGFTGFLLIIYFLKRPKLIYLIVSGLLFSIAFQIKQISVFYGMFAGLMILIYNIIERALSLKRCVFYLFVFSVSWIIPVLFSLFIIWNQGALEDFKLWIFNIGPQYTSEANFSNSIPTFKASVTAVLRDYIWLWLLSIIGIVLIFFNKKDWFNKIFILGLYIFCFITVIPGYHYFGHYFLLWMPAIALSIGISIDRLKAFLMEKTKSVVLSILISILVFFSAVGSNIYTLKEYYFKPDYRKVLRRVYGMNAFPEAMAIAGHFDSIISREDKLVVFGSAEYEMYVYLNKIASTKYLFPESFVRFKVPQQKQWLNEFFNDMSVLPPDYIIYFDDPKKWKINTEFSDLLDNWFNTFSAKNYNMIGYADIFGDHTNYVWDLKNNDKASPRSKYKVLIYKRKTDV